MRRILTVPALIVVLGLPTSCSRRPNCGSKDVLNSVLGNLVGRSSRSDHYNYLEFKILDTFTDGKSDNECDCSAKFEVKLGSIVREGSTTYKVTKSDSGETYVQYLGIPYGQDSLALIQYMQQDTDFIERVIEVEVSDTSDNNQTSSLRDRVLSRINLVIQAQHDNQDRSQSRVDPVTKRVLDKVGCCSNFMTVHPDQIAEIVQLVLSKINVATLKAYAEKYAIEKAEAEKNAAAQIEYDAQRAKAEAEEAAREAASVAKYRAAGAKIRAEIDAKRAEANTRYAEAHAQRAETSAQKATLKLAEELSRKDPNNPTLDRTKYKSDVEWEKALINELIKRAKK